MSETTAEQEALDYSERWLHDGLAVLQKGVSVLHTTVDMTEALRQLDGLREGGVAATTTHLLVRAAARALAANPRLHQVIVGNRRLRPNRVDIGLSVTGETFIAPVLVIEGADRKSVAEIAAEVARRVPEVQAADRKSRGALKRWGWLLPFSPLRRAVLRWQFGKATYRRKIAGTFQVSTVPLDWALTSTIVASGVLIGGQVRSRVVAIEGRPAVRPIMNVTLSGDHGVWDGRAAARFLSAVQADLESGHVVQSA